MAAVCRICPCVPFGDKRVGHFQAPNKLQVVAFADMAQLVERILGKDEVPSSILGISTKNNLVLRPREEFVWKP
jgi:hypothetical protein